MCLECGAPIWLVILIELGAIILYPVYVGYCAFKWCKAKVRCLVNKKYRVERARHRARVKEPQATYLKGSSPIVTEEKTAPPQVHKDDAPKLGSGSGLSLTSDTSSVSTKIFESPKRPSMLLITLLVPQSDMIPPISNLNLASYPL
ncbi:hypothetical protein DL93DRAFT_2100995 [Clavulina sp. PMI_390]|nr:hypothetical protein DL93DRAFT_2100995 [Clavulina sp. PMI_390]